VIESLPEGGSPPASGTLNDASPFRRESLCGSVEIVVPRIGFPRSSILFAVIGIVHPLE
jgi:hypothetical protein